MITKRIVHEINAWDSLDVKVLKRDKWTWLHHIELCSAFQSAQDIQTIIFRIGNSTCPCSPNELFEHLPCYKTS